MIWGNGFRDLGPTKGGLAPPRTACGRAGGGCGRGSLPPIEGVRWCHPRKKIFLKIFDAKSRVWGQLFGPENKLIEGQPNENDVICRNASVLAFHLWPTIFAGAPFQLQNICRNGVPPRSRPLHPWKQLRLKKKTDLFAFKYSYSYCTGSCSVRLNFSLVEVYHTEQFIGSSTCH